MVSLGAVCSGLVPRLSFSSHVILPGAGCAVWRASLVLTLTYYTNLLRPSFCIKPITRTNRIIGPAETASVRPLSQQHELTVEQCFGAAAYSWNVWQPTHHQSPLDSSACGAARLKSRVHCWCSASLCCCMQACLMSTLFLIHSSRRHACSSNREGTCLHPCQQQATELLHISPCLSMVQWQPSTATAMAAHQQPQLSPRSFRRSRQLWHTSAADAA